MDPSSEDSAQRLHTARATVQASVDSLYSLIGEHCLDTDGDLSRSLEALKKRSASKEVRLAILGEFSAGKTFVNALLHTDILQTGILPTTAVCTYVSYGSQPECEVLVRNVGLVRVTPKEVGAFAAERPRSAEVEEVRLKLPSVSLAKGLIVIDTPGVNVNIDEHEALTDRAIREANACVYLMDARQPGKKTTVDFLRRIHNRIDKFFFVLNRSDILDDDEQREALEFLRNVLKEECGICDPQLALISARLARHGKGIWNQRFFELESKIQAFMQNERQFVIAGEVADIASVVNLRAKRLLENKWSLAEQELARHHKVRLPDSDELIERLRHDVVAVVKKDAASLGDGIDKYHKEITSTLRSSVIFEVNYARSKDDLTRRCQDEIGNHFQSASEHLQQYLVEHFHRTFDTANEIVTNGVANLINGVTWLEDRVFLSRPLPYIFVAIGGLTGLFVAGSLFSWSDVMWHSASLVSCVCAGALAGLVVARAFWGKRIRFVAPKIDALDPRAFASQASSGLLFGYEKSARPVMSGIGQAGMRFGINSGHPLFAAIGMGLTAVSALFAPSFEKLQKEIMAKSLQACDNFSSKAASGASVFITKGYEQVLAALLDAIKNTVNRYDGVIAKLVRSQKSITEGLERRRVSLQSAVEASGQIQARIADAAVTIHCTLRGYETVAPTSGVHWDGAVKNADLTESNTSDFDTKGSSTRNEVETEDSGALSVRSDMLFYGRAPDSSAGHVSKGMRGMFLWWAAAGLSILLFVFGITRVQQRPSFLATSPSSFLSQRFRSNRGQPSTASTPVSSEASSSSAKVRGPFANPDPTSITNLQSSSNTDKSPTQPPSVPDI